MVGRMKRVGPEFERVMEGLRREIKEVHGRDVPFTDLTDDIGAFIKNENLDLHIISRSKEKAKRPRRRVRWF